MLHNTDEHLNEIMKRAESMKNRDILRKKMIREGVAAFSVIVLIVLAAIWLPRVTGGENAARQIHYGSLILRVSYMGYVVIGVLAFILGIVVACLCFHWRNLKQNEQEKE